MSANRRNAGNGNPAGAASNQTATTRNGNGRRRNRRAGKGNGGKGKKKASFKRFWPYVVILILVGFVSFVLMNQSKKKAPVSTGPTAEQLLLEFKAESEAQKASLEADFNRRLAEAQAQSAAEAAAKAKAEALAEVAKAAAEAKAREAEIELAKKKAIAELTASPKAKISEVTHDAESGGGIVMSLGETRKKNGASYKLLHTEPGTGRRKTLMYPALRPLEEIKEHLVFSGFQPPAGELAVFDTVEHPVWGPMNVFAWKLR